MTEIERTHAIFFADQLRSARLAALADAEAFDEIIHVVERLGSYLSKVRLGDNGSYGTLFKYTLELKTLACQSSLEERTFSQPRNLLTPFETLYELVTEARNDALHQGAFARHLTRHAVELEIILEDALSTYKELVVSDFMVQNPSYAELWQPVSFVRQQMLANSYSYMPILDKIGKWHVLSDAAIAAFLGSKRSGPERVKKLTSTLETAWDSLKSYYLEPVDPIEGNTSLDDALSLLKKHPILLVKAQEERGLLGILTAFDLL